jgi:hypothetical protein
MQNQYPRMLYKADGSEEIHGGKFSTTIVHDEAEQAAALAAGWELTTTEATDAAKPTPAPTPAPTLAPRDDAPPTRAELEQKAHELGVEFAPNIGDKKLLERIEAKLDEQAAALAAGDKPQE